MRIRQSPLRIPWLVVLMALLRMPLTSHAADAPATQSATLPAPDEKPPVVFGLQATLELTLPAGTTATVDDKEIGELRSIHFDAIPVNQSQRAKVVVKFPDNTEEQRLVDLEPGRQVLLVVNKPVPDKPVAVALSGMPPVTSVAVSPDSRFVAAATEDRAIVLWDLAAGKPVRSYLGHDDRVTSVRFTSDGKRLLTGSADQTAILWDVQSGIVLQTYKGHKAGVLSAAISPDQKWVLTGSGDNTAILWDAQTGRQVRDFTAHKMDVSSVAFSPDGSKLALGSFDGSLGVYETLTGKQIYLIRAHRDYVSGVVFTPDGTKVISGSYDNTSAIWDLETGKKLRSTARQNLDVIGVATTVDSRAVFTSGRDASVNMYNISNSQKIRAFLGHTNEANAITVTPDGRLLVSGSQDGTVRLWDLATGLELVCLSADTTAKGWAAVTPDGLFDGSNSGRLIMGFIFAKNHPGTSVNQLFKDFFHPGLLAQIDRGQRPYATAMLGQSLPPTVKFISPKARNADAQEATITIEATDQGGGVSDIYLYNNNARITPHAEPIREGKTVRQSFQLALTQGLNRIRTSASNADHSWDSAPAELELTYNHPLERKARMYVVAVGITSGAAPFAAKDATALADTIRRRHGKQYDRVDVIPLLDSEATKSMIEDTLADVAALAKPQDTLVLLLNGLGSQLGEQLTFLPGDLSPQRGLSEESLRTAGVTLSRLSEIMGTTAALKRAMIIDVAASAATSPTSSEQNAFDLHGAMERLDRAQGIFAIAAVTHGNQPPASLRHSLLTYTLLSAVDAEIPGPLDGKTMEPADSSGSADITEWFNFAAIQSRVAARQLLIEPPYVDTTTQASGFSIVQLAK